MLEFDGSEELWDEWSEKIMAIGTHRGWDTALDDNSDLPDPSTSDTNEKERLKANKAAYNYLLLSCKGTAFKLVRNKERHAGKSWANLKETYDVSKKLDYLTLLQRLNSRRSPVANRTT